MTKSFFYSDDRFGKRRLLAGLLCGITLFVLLCCHSYRQTGYLSVFPTPVITAAAFSGPLSASPSSSYEIAPMQGDDVIDYVLLLGVDRDNGRIGRTDAIVIAAFNHTQKEIGVLIYYLRNSLRKNKKLSCLL